MNLKCISLFVECFLGLLSPLLTVPDANISALELSHNFMSFREYSPCLLLKMTSFFDLGNK